jgi:hypothetical protein
MSSIVLDPRSLSIVMAYLALSFTGFLIPGGLVVWGTIASTRHFVTLMLDPTGQGGSNSTFHLI